MAFSDNIKDSLVREECKWECCARAELAAAILLSGGIAFHGFGKLSLSVFTWHNSVSRYYFSLIKKFFGITCQIRTYKTEQLNKRTRFELSIPNEDVDTLMDKLMLRDAEALFGVRSVPNAEIIQKGCCRAAFLKSAFLISGSVSSPEKSYAFTIACGNRVLADFALSVMQGYIQGGNVSRRRSQFVAYSKGADAVSALLSAIGAYGAVMELENVRILKDFKNSANRLVNCDNNNIERTISSARTQIEAIRFLDEKIGIDNLPIWAKEIARLRLEETEATLTELGEMCDPPIGKSGVNNRLRRICELAQKLKTDE